MKNIYRIIIAVLIFCNYTSFAQLPPHYYKYTTPSVKVNNLPIKNPWAGGINSASFNTIDLNGDGIKDLFLWEHQYQATFPTSFKMRTFINNGTPNKIDYEYAPQYETHFPQDLHDWVLLVDYDCDGREDLFSYTYAGGMVVYHNDSSAGGISFSLAYPLVYCMYLGNTYANLYVSRVNQPALIDVNGDGDLDILTFTILGGAIEYHENMAQELFSRCDTLVFHQQRQYWGGMSLSPFANTAFLNCITCHSRTSSKVNEQEKTMLHSGSCLVGYDEAGDNDVDLINGDILSNTLLYLENTPPAATNIDSIVLQDSLFPVYDTSVNYIRFPAPNVFDANNDGKEDLIVSGCTEDQSENYDNNLFYENIGNNSNHNFHFNKKRFLTDEMIDVGSGSNVTFFDADGDGLKDLIIGNLGYFISNAAIPHQESALAFLKNTTVGNNPSFSLISTDYANLKQYNLIGIKPTYGDLDNDGDDDMLIGNSDGNLYYFINTGGTFTLAPNGINYQSIDVGNNSSPQLFDVDNDGLLDLLIGETFGNIWYYQNTGTLTAPTFTYVKNNFGGVNVTNTTWSLYGFSVPHMYTENGQQKLIVGSENGYLYLYDNITGNLGGTFNLVDSTAFDVYEPYRANADMEDLTGDGIPEIIVGNFAGGLSFYSHSLTGVETVQMQSDDVTIYPNPAWDKIIVEFKNRNAKSRTIDIFDVPGKLIKSVSSNQYKEVISVNTLSKGIYFVKITEDNNTVTKKIVVK